MNKALCISLLSFFSIHIFGQTSDSVKIYLWPNGAPLAQGVAEEDKPSLTVYFPEKEKANGASVLICPGGGYVTLALNHEGWQVAKWFNQLGFTAAILRYRVGTWDHKKYKHPVPLMDVTRGMRLLRSKAKEWNLNSEKQGVLGFSAGGHLASCAATMFDGGNPKSKDPIETMSSKPYFAVLVYPVISMKTKYAHDFSRGVLLGENASHTLLDSMSTDTRVTNLTPPTFLVHASDDPVRCENSILFYSSLLEHNVPCEMHIYEKGGHGFGFYPKEKSIIDWPDRLKYFLKNRNINIKD